MNGGHTSTDDVSVWVDQLMAAEAPKWRATLEELRQEAWVAVLEHGQDADAVRRRWRKMGRGDRLKKAGRTFLAKQPGAIGAFGFTFQPDTSHGWEFDWMISLRDDGGDPAEQPEPVKVPAELVDPKALALVEAVMLDGADLDAARAPLGLNRKQAERIMRAAGLTVRGERIEHRRPDLAGTVEGLLAFQERTAPRYQFTFTDVAREMGRTQSSAEQLLHRWERTGVIQVPRSSTGRRQWDWVSLAGLFVLDKAHAAARPRPLPVAWDDLASAITSPSAQQVRFEPGRDRWTVGTGGTSPLTVSLMAPRSRARRLLDPDMGFGPTICGCGCGRRLRSDNTTGLAAPCLRRLWAQRSRCPELSGS